MRLRIGTSPVGCAGHHSPAVGPIKRPQFFCRWLPFARVTPSSGGGDLGFLEPADNRFEAVLRDPFCDTKAFAVEIASHSNFLPVELAGVLWRSRSPRDEAKHVTAEIFVVVSRQRAGETHVAKG